MKSSSGEILVGAAGRATELILTIEDSDPPDCGGTVAGWFLQCPGQSPAWQHYGLSINASHGTRSCVISKRTLRGSTRTNHAA